MSEFASHIELSSLTTATGFQINGEATADGAGNSVAAAGDINGDGFADYIIGASGQNADGLTDAGAAYVVYGTAAGMPDLNLSALNGTNGFQISGENATNLTGISVGGAGDFNRDGYDDFIIGATGLDVTGSNSGGAYVVFGKSGSFGAEFDLSQLNGTNGFQINGEAAGDLAGRSVKSAGDVNGDGFGDIVIGATENDTRGANSGTSYVLFGKSSGFSDVNLTSLTGTTGFHIHGEAAGDLSGSSVASAGDMNKDGFADIIIGAPEANGGTGAAYVVFGKSSGFGDVELSALNGSNGFKISGAATNDDFGGSVSTAGDINGDGYADVIIGAAGHDYFNASSNRGAAYVIMGKNKDVSAYAANINVSTLIGTTPIGTNGINGANGGFRILGEFRDSRVNDAAGFSVSNAGDVNGDGLSDMIVSAPGHDWPNNVTNPTLDGYSPKNNIGASYVIFGKTSAFGSTFQLEDSSDAFFQIVGEVDGDQIGTSVARAGDINNDGFGDLIVGASNMNSGVGGAYVIYGRAPTTTVRRDGTDIGQQITTGSGADFLYGKGGNDKLISNGGNDLLDGGTGNDRMIGGTGNDTYVVDSTTDIVTELANQGTDTVQSASFSLSLSSYANVENLKLDGTGNFNLTGNSGNNVLTGNTGNNTLSGGGGKDTFEGGKGNDVFVSDGGDTIVEISGQGTDRLDSSVTVKALANNVENLRLTGTTAIDGIGNSLANTIEGNTANNRLDGGTDSVTDTLIGGGGNDTYVLRGGNDLIIDSGGTSDTVESTVSRSLASYASVDKLVLIGGDMNGTGNALNNIIMGTVGKNILDGAAGNDRLEGGGGNDTYIVNGGDTVVENANAGKDTVQSSATVTALWSNVENLTLTGSTAINGTGNTLANIMIGNGAANVFDGLTGSDTMTGGAGDDTFVFASAINSSTNLETITDFFAADDTIKLQNTGTGLFNVLATGTLSAAAFKANSTGTATDADDRIVYNTSTGHLFYDTNGNAAGGSKLFAVLANKAAITNLDFVII